jgi:hypothetical protein
LRFWKSWNAIGLLAKYLLWWWLPNIEKFGNRRICLPLQLWCFLKRIPPASRRALKLNPLSLRQQLIYNNSEK